MKKRWLLLVLLLSGCWDVKEPENMLYLYGMGIDYEDGEYVTYAQIIELSAIAKSEQPRSPDTIQAEIAKYKGENISEAFYQMYETIDQQLFWGHFKYIILSEEVLKEGRANTVFNTFMRFHDIRYNTWVYSTKEKMSDVMLTSPVLNQSISNSKLSDPLNAYSQNSFIEPLNMRRLIIGLNEPSYEVNIPQLKLSDGWESNKGKKQVTKINGVAVLTPTELKGFIGQEQAQGLQWMSDKAVRINMTITTEEFKDQKISISIEDSKVKVVPHINGSEVTFTVKIEGVATLISFLEPLNTEEVKRAASEQIKKEVLATFEEGLKQEMDVYRLSEYVFRKNIKAFRELEVDGQIPLTKDSIRQLDVIITNVSLERKNSKEAIK